ncbi:MAG: hypothetical protein DCO99_03485 [Synechococcus sp. XM-24]|nr:MAG: hypothetical protein DCO99_03485 [Synechococcus sp. XM-24]
MVKSLVKTSALMAASALLSSLPALAQVSAANVRALNVARNWAVNNNGGLSVYRPAACMFNTGDGGGSCLTQNNSQGFRFKFLGGAPGWQQLGTPATTETEIQISSDGRTVSNVIYNGSPR